MWLDVGTGMGDLQASFKLKVSQWGFTGRYRMILLGEAGGLLLRAPPGFFLWVTSMFCS